jgi:hypothetical protein
MSWTRMVDPQSQRAKINLGSASSAFGHELEHEQGPQKSPEKMANTDWTAIQPRNDEPGGSGNRKCSINRRTSFQPR